MSLMPEMVIQEVLVKGIRTFRENPDLIDMLFRNLTQEDVMGLRDFIVNSSIDIAINWPATPPQLPAIIIALKSEAESQAFLGDVMQGPRNVEDTGTPFDFEDEAGDPANEVGSGSLSNLANETFTLAGPYRVTAATISTLIFETTDEIFNISDPFEVPEVLVVIREGQGAGQRRVVNTMSRNAASKAITVEVTSNWMTIPDATSVFDFQFQDAGHITGEPSKLFGTGAVVERKGALYRTSYQLSIAGPNPEITICLYAMVKAIFFIFCEWMQQRGIIEPKVSGTDFVQKPEYLPDPSYLRALILEFQYGFDVYLTVETIKRIAVALSVRDPNVGDSSGVSRTVSETTLNLAP